MTHVTTCATLIRNGRCSCPIHPLQVRAKGHVTLYCPTCEKPARVWPYGTHATVAQLILAEQQHLAAVHAPTPDYSAVADGVYEDGTA